MISNSELVKKNSGEIVKQESSTEVGGELLVREKKDVSSSISSSDMFSSVKKDTPPVLKDVDDIKEDVKVLISSDKKTDSKKFPEIESLSGISELTTTTSSSSVTKIDLTKPLDKPSDSFRKDILKLVRGTSNDSKFEFTKDTKSFTKENLKNTHEFLIKNGYEFMGYRGTQAVFITEFMNNGIDKEGIWDTRKKGEVGKEEWRGVYLFKNDPELCCGYTYYDGRDCPKAKEELTEEDKTGCLLRLYAPKEFCSSPMNVDMKDIPLDVENLDKKLSGEFGETIGKKDFSLGKSDVPYAITGMQGIKDEDAKKRETVVSWSAAQGCVVIPSLIKPDEYGYVGVTKEVINFEKNL